MFQQCISNIYNVFTNYSQNWLYTDWMAEPLTEWFFEFVEPKWLFYGIAVKNLLSTFIFKSVPSQIVPYSTVLTRTAWWK